jgi:hypothetical protein
MGVRREMCIGVFAMLSLILFVNNIAWADNSDVDWSELRDIVRENYPWLFEEIKENKANISGKEENQQYTKPTFGLDHQNNQKIIDSGFKINNQTFSINDNFHTPFKEQVIKIGETNTFEAKLFASEGLRVQDGCKSFFLEFLKLGRLTMQSLE